MGEIVEIKAKMVFESDYNGGPIYIIDEDDNLIILHYPAKPKSKRKFPTDE